jgi:hypothetical protein
MSHACLFLHRLTSLQIFTASGHKRFTVLGALTLCSSSQEDDTPGVDEEMERSMKRD